ncbi:caspase family protein [Mitsuaria sp. GD03876]|uniref:caspase family protein n=1 Tax=Mitsuaria sp. GD03876 TaxID=2975399 RepID=UPI0024481FAD|nr:caspase family protein [Mitsuaria sp. GD03876]MDH0863926.1 caspase family protein [Mitsuaria sp. GD03876]
MLIALVSAASAVGGVRAQTSAYLEEREPARHALVIGNSDYVALAPLSSAKLDGDRVAARLQGLKFKVTHVPNIESVRQLEDEVLPAFRKSIEPGDFVLVFFSGHGFTYGPNNFLAPTGMGLSIKAGEVGDVAIAIESLQDYLEKRSPGLLLMLIDACRTIAGFVVSAPGNQNLVAKSIAEPVRGSRTTNSMIGFAARPGFIAIGSEAADQLSLFSASLVERIAAQDDDFGSVFKDVSVDVLQNSGNVQHPGLFDWSNTNPFLNPGATTLERERAAWQAALDSGKRPVIERFAMRNSISRFAMAARRWLDQHPQDSATSRFTLISPAAVERAWRPDGARVAIVPTFGGFAFDRALPLNSGEWVAYLDNEDLGLVPSGKKDVQPQLHRLKQSFLAHGAMVATADVGGSRAAAYPGRVDEVVKAGSRVNVEGFTTTKSGLPVLVGRIPGDEEQIYVQLAANWESPVAPVELGRSLSELILPPPVKGFKDVIDPALVQARLAELKQQKRTLTWVSIAVSPSIDTHVYDGRLARATHAAYVLKRAGIDERRISSMPAADDVSGDGVRLRFFGY